MLKTIAQLDSLVSHWRRHDERVRRTVRRLEDLLEISRRERQAFLQALLDNAASTRALRVGTRRGPKRSAPPPRVEVILPQGRRHALLRDAPGAGVARIPHSAVALLRCLSAAEGLRVQLVDLRRQLGGCSYSAIKTRLWRIRSALLRLSITPDSIRLRNRAVEMVLDVRWVEVADSETFAETVR